MPVQMCMALPSDLMASLQFDSVTNYRASDDYASEGNMDIGGSALLAFALGLRPSKDNFWTHRPQSAVDSGKPWGVKDNPGANCELNLIIATLSTGPVGIGDKAGNTNRTLLLRSIRPDGLIIQPDKPVTSIDAMLTPPSWGRRPSGHLWTTYAHVPGGPASGQELRWYYVLAIDVSSPWQLQGTDPYPRIDPASGWVARRWHLSDGRPTPCVQGQLARASGCLLAQPLPRIVNDRPIMVRNDTKTYDLFHLAPVLANGWVLLGDTSRYVAVSQKRFGSISIYPRGIRVVVTGASGEHLFLTALCPASEDWAILVKEVRFTSAEPMTLYFSAGEAVAWI